MYSGVAWTRTDRPAKVRFEIATTDSFKDVLRGVTLDALPESDFAVKALVDGLPPGQDIFYRTTPWDLSYPTTAGEPVIGRFRRAPADKRSISFVWSGDTAGQGWGIDESRGGMRCHATMMKHRPDFFLRSGDTIYADAALAPEVKLPEGASGRTSSPRKSPRSPRR